MRLTNYGIGLAVLLTALFLGAGLLRTESAPSSTFTAITGKRIDLPALRGRPVLITFWATHCPGCLREIPDLITLYQTYHPAGLEMIAVAMQYDPPSHVVAFARSQRLPYDVVLDLDGRHAFDFGRVQVTPSTFLIDAQGRIIDKITGQWSLSAMQKKLQPLLTG